MYPPNHFTDRDKQLQSILINYLGLSNRLASAVSCNVPDSLIVELMHEVENAMVPRELMDNTSKLLKQLRDTNYGYDPYTMEVDHDTSQQRHIRGYGRL